MERLRAVLERLWLWLIGEWLTRTQAGYTTATDGSRDRSLPGKARRRARRAAR